MIKHAISGSLHLNRVLAIAAGWNTAKASRVDQSAEVNNKNQNKTKQRKRKVLKFQTAISRLFLGAAII